MRFLHSSFCSVKGIEDETFTMRQKSISAWRGFDTLPPSMEEQRGWKIHGKNQYSRAQAPLCVIWWGVREVPPAGNAPNTTWKQRIQSWDGPAPRGLPFIKTNDIPVLWSSFIPQICILWLENTEFYLLWALNSQTMVRARSKASHIQVFPWAELGEERGARKSRGTTAINKMWGF